MQVKKRRFSRLKIGFAVFAVLLLVLITAFALYTSVYYPADEAAQADIGQADVPVWYGSGYIACGKAESAQTGFIFYPGAKVEATAYLPYLIEVAEKADILCVVVEPAFRLSILSPNAAAGAMATFPQIGRWYLGGHSLGGVVAAGFAGRHPQQVQGLVLLAAYPNVDLSASGLAVLSVTATEDRVLNRQSYEDAKQKLPPDTHYVAVAGGNHAQFGSYGPQKGDGEPQLSAAGQQQQVVSYTLAFLHKTS